MPKVRWLMIFMCCLANTINYVDRANLAVAVPLMQHDLGFDAATMGMILGGFFWTYAFMQMPFGWFADRVGARIALSIAVVWWSIFTALTAAARSVAALMGCRLLLGVGEAGAYPSCAKVAANWFPRSERGLAASIFDSGSRIGAVVSLPIVAWLISAFTWQMSFIVTGMLGIIWTVFWIFIYRDPEKHPAVTPEELARLQAERGNKTAAGPKVPWSTFTALVYAARTSMPSMESNHFSTTPESWATNLASR
jgi:MFS transporter, ACS family, D-galactonate transporter